jgi:ribosome biogenesis GTPase A
MHVLISVGKSSLINALRGIHLRKKSTLYVAPEAGATKSVHERLRVCNNPPVFLYDTPGIMNPSINTMDTGMRLASCGIKILWFWFSSVCFRLTWYVYVYF